jgi:putative ABC transport system permease protein
MCAAVLLTTGRTVGAEQDVLSSIDSAGTRSIVVRAEPGAGLDTTVLDRLANIDGIEWAGAFGSALDVQNLAFPGGNRVPVREAYSSSINVFGSALSTHTTEARAFASARALEELGMVGAAGAVSTVTDQIEYPITGKLVVPSFLEFLEPVVIVPRSVEENPASSVSVLVVIAEKPDLVGSLSVTVQSLLAVEDVSKVKLQTSQNLATLRALIEGQLGTFGRDLIVVIFGITAVLVAAILYGLVMLRRKDFGRRRALGATRGLIIGLLLTQMLLLSVIGAVIGCVISALVLLTSGDPQPPFLFYLAVAILATATGLVSASVPAVAASRRDPLRELRVP